MSTALVLALLVAAVVIFVLLRAAGSTRALVRRELAAYLLATIPGSRIEKMQLDSFVLHTPEMPGTQVNLVNVTEIVRALRPNTAATRQSVYERFAAPLLQPKLDELSLEVHGPRILPRIVNESFVDQMENQLPLPLRALGFTGLSVAYILDSEHHVTYIARHHADMLGLDDLALHELALANLRATFKPEAIEAALRGEAISVLQAFDDHDAARLLLIPEHLDEDQALAAFIPDKGTLILAPAPADDDWEALHGFRPGVAKLYDRPLRVTRQGIGVVPVSG